METVSILNSENNIENSGDIIDVENEDITDIEDIDINDKEPVRAGILDKFNRMFDKLLGPLTNSIDKCIDNLIDNHIDIDVPNNAANGNLYFKCTTQNNEELLVKAIPTAGRDGMFDLYIKFKNGQTETYPQTKTDDIDANIIKAIKKHLGEDSLKSGYETAKEEKEKIDKKPNPLQDRNADFDINEETEESEEVNESRKFRVKLQSVNGNIFANDVRANYASSAVMCDLALLLDDEQFTDSIPNTETDYEVIPDSTTVNVYPVDEYSDEVEIIDNETSPEIQALTEIMQSAYSTYLNMQYIHWNAERGKNFLALHDITGSLTYTLQGYIDYIAETMMTFENIEEIPNPICILSNLDCEIDAVASADVLTAKQILNGFIMSISVNYDYLPKRVQSEMDNWLNDLEKTANYHLERLLDDNADSLDNLDW